MRLATFIVLGLAFSGCEIRDESYRRADRVTVGMTEQQAIAAAGAPSNATTATTICKRAGAVRELVYGAVTIYFGGLMKSDDGAILLCIDDKGRVIDKSQIDW